MVTTAIPPTNNVVSTETATMPSSLVRTEMSPVRVSSRAAPPRRTGSSGKEEVVEEVTMGSGRPDVADGQQLRRVEREEQPVRKGECAEDEPPQGLVHGRG